MQRVSRSTAVSSLPAPPSTGTSGYFSAGNPATGQQPTVPGYEWFNAVQEEIVSVLVAAGLSPNPTQFNQLAQAVQLLAGTSSASMLAGRMLLQDRKSSGTSGGATLANGIQKRDLNTVAFNGISGASLNNSQVTLPAGNYFIDANFTTDSVNKHAVGVFNVTTGAYIARSNVCNGSDFSISNERITTAATVKEPISLSALSVLEFRHWTQNARSDGFGQADSQFGYELYSQVEIFKV